MKPQRVVVYGGTFDPVHNGHIAIAKCLRDELHADAVVMIPAGRPWLRPDTPTASPSHRLQMVELATKNESRIEVSDVDIIRDKTTYSIDTIQDLRPQYGPDCEFILAVGADSIPNLHRWHRYNQLVKECTFAVVERPGSPLDDTAALPANTLVIRGPMIDVSASEIRSMIAQDNLTDAANVLPDSVFRHIIENDLYR